ncbi:hypothetical protein LINPERPRIM_LOCUS37052, partial [Linum perenne]
FLLACRDNAKKEDVGAAEPREYKAWTKEDKQLIMGVVKMVDDRQLENGNFKAGGYKDLERWLHTQIPGCKLKEDPHIKSRHRYFKEKFCAQLELKNYASGFGWDEIRQCLTMDDTTWVGYVKGKLDVNARYDIHATGLQDTENNEVNKNSLPKEKAPSSLSGQKRGRAQAMQDEMTHIGGNIAQTTSDIARIATIFCMDDSLHMRRQYLFHEISSFTELSRHQRYKAIRKLMYNDGDAATYFQMPDVDAKVEFILNMLD